VLFEVLAFEHPAAANPEQNPRTVEPSEP